MDGKHDPVAEVIVIPAGISFFNQTTGQHLLDIKTLPCEFLQEMLSRRSVAEGELMDGLLGNLAILEIGECFLLPFQALAKKMAA